MKALATPAHPGTVLSVWVPLLLLSITAALTTWVVFFLHPMEQALYSDMANYAAVARDITSGTFDLRHFHQPIGFPLWMVFWRTIAGGDWWLLKVTHVALIVSSVFLGWRAARLVLPHPWDIVVLVLLSFQIQWWALAGFAIAEALYTFLLTAMLWSAMRWISTRRIVDGVLAGLFFGLGFYVKGSAVFFPVMVLCWYVLMAYRREESPLPPFRHLLIAAGVALCVALTHGLGALATYGKFKVSADAGALNLVEGKCREKDNRDSEGHRWLSPLFYRLGERDIKTWDEPFSNQAFFWKEGLKCIKANPTVMITSTRYIYYLFGGNSLWPVQAWRDKPAETFYERMFLFVITPLTFVGMIMALRQLNRPEIMAALLILSLMLLVYVFKSELRYRVPFDAATMILATVGARAITQQLLRRRRRNDAPSQVRAGTR